MQTEPKTCKPYVEAVTAVVQFGFSGSVTEAAVMRMASIAGISDILADLMGRRATQAEFKDEVFGCEALWYIRQGQLGRISFAEAAAR